MSRKRNTFSLLQTFKLIFFFGLLLTIARYANANDNEQTERERIEQAAKEHLGDALQPCINYLEMHGTCMFEEEPDACQQYPALLELVPEDKRNYCEDLMKPANRYVKLETGVKATVNQRDKTVLEVETKKTTTKPADFAKAFANTEDSNNCERFLTAVKLCAEGAGQPSKTHFCEASARFFKELSKHGKQACQQVKVQVYETLEKNLQELEQELAQTKFEL